MSKCLKHVEKERSFGSSYITEEAKVEFISAKNCKAAFNPSRIHIKNLRPEPRNIFITYKSLDFQHRNVQDILTNNFLKKDIYTSDRIISKEDIRDFLYQKLLSNNKLRNLEKDRNFIKEISLEEALTSCDETLEAHDRKWRESTQEEVARIYKIINLEEGDEGDL